jgi:multicomponent K+:H+ antiporter subunit A
VVLIGVAPFLADGIVTAAASAVTGAELHPHLKIWHGVTPALFMSVHRGRRRRRPAHALHRPLDRAWIAAPRPEAKAIFDAAGRSRGALGRAGSPRRCHDGAISRYLGIFAVASIALGSSPIQRQRALRAEPRTMLPVPPVIAVGWLMLIVATVVRDRDAPPPLPRAGSCGHHRALDLGGLRLPLGARSRADADLGRNGDDHAAVCWRCNFLPKTTPRESPAGLKIRDGADRAGGGRRRRRARLRLPDARCVHDLRLPPRQQLRGRRRHECRQRDPRGFPGLRHLSARSSCWGSPAS